MSLLKLLSLCSAAAGPAPVSLAQCLTADDLLLSKATAAAGLILLLHLVRRSRPKERVIFNF